MRLDHVTIRTRDIAGTRLFFESVFNLKTGHRPISLQQIPGHWLYDHTGDPVVHIIGTSGTGFSQTAEAIDHVGFRLEGYASFRTKLESMGIRYSTMELPELQERRLFFRAPGGPLLEAVFSESIPEDGEHEIH